MKLIYDWLKIVALLFLKLAFFNYLFLAFLGLLVTFTCFFSLLCYHVGKLLRD